MTTKQELWKIAESLEAQSKEHYDKADKGKGAGFNADGMGAVAESVTGLVLIGVSVAIKRAIMEASS